MALQSGQSGFSEQAIAALARESGASEQQIREIVSLVGHDRASILREARLAARNASATLASATWPDGGS